MRSAAVPFICALLLGLSGPAQRDGDRSRAAGAGTVERGLVILAQFPDVSHGVTREYAERRFFRELDEYARQMSYGTVSIEGDVTEKWITLPDPVEKYRISSRNLEVDKDRVRKLIVDALAGVDEDYDLSKYSFVAVFLGARFKDYGMMGLCGYPGMLGWSSEDVLKTPGGQALEGGAAIFCYPAHLGTLFHDVAHIVGGVKDGARRVPCLYDHDLQARAGDVRETFLDSIVNVGFWDPMSCHYVRWDSPPPGICSWTRLRLGWMPAEKVVTADPKKRTTVTLDPLDDGDGKTLAIEVPLSDSTYCLIENRRRAGFDKNLPGAGVLILYADDDVKECRKGRTPVKLMDATPSRRRLQGAAFDADGRGEFADEENGLRVRILSKEGDSYEIEVGPY